METKDFSNACGRAIENALNAGGPGMKSVRLDKATVTIKVFQGNEEVSQMNITARVRIPLDLAGSVSL
jgi:hypothetical protein